MEDALSATGRWGKINYPEVINIVHRGIVKDGNFCKLCTQKIYSNGKENLYL